MGLCCLGGLRGLWGFCTRVELGGLEACSVFAFRFLSFASVFLLLSLCLLSFYALCLSSGALPLLLLGLSSCIVFVSLSLWVDVSFSLSDKTKKSAFVLRSFFTWFWCLYFNLSNAIIALL